MSGGLPRGLHTEQATWRLDSDPALRPSPGPVRRSAGGPGARSGLHEMWGQRFMRAAGDAEAEEELDVRGVPRPRRAMHH